MSILCKTLFSNHHMKRMWLACFGLFGLTVASAVPAVLQAGRDLNALDPYPTKPRLTFREDGSFKITVFSDLHYGENPWDSWGPEQDANSTRLMRKILADEGASIDYIVINGDLVTGENTFRENSTKLIDEIVGPLNDAKIPFSSTQGNHDNQANITHLEEIEREQKVAPLSYTRTSPPGVGGESGPGNYWVPVYTNIADSTPSLILWFFDSRGGVSPNPDPVQLPDWVDDSVATWIEQETTEMESEWGPSENRGAIAFVHIPPHVVQGLQATLDNTTSPGLDDDVLGQGSTQATVNPSNVGKDMPFWNALNKYVKNIHTIVSGHDHGNEWCMREKTKDVIFCFDKHAGYGGYDNPTWGHGVRHLLLSSPDPAVPVETWIRLEEGETRGRVLLDSSYN